MGLGFFSKKIRKKGHIIILTTSKFKKVIGTKIVVKKEGICFRKSTRDKITEHILPTSMKSFFHKRLKKAHKT